MIHDIAIAMWFFIPAGIANMAPVFAARAPNFIHLNAPLDGGKTWRGRRIFGDNKTWRGLVAGVLTGIVVIWVQTYALRFMPDLHEYLKPLDYSTFSITLVGALLGLGAILGDAVESFFKRQKGIAAGSTWLPFDQIDFVIGAALLTMPVVWLGGWHYVWAVVAYFVFHVISTYIAWKIGMKKTPL